MAQLAKHESRIATASIIIHELNFGIERLPKSKRRQRLESYLNNVVFATIPVIPYDTQAALWHGRERARLLTVGLPKPFADSQIAAIAVVNQLILVTANLKDFTKFDGLVVENWFQTMTETQPDE